MIELLLIQAEWIERLRDDDIEVRDEATRKLLELGECAGPYLERARHDPDSEVRSRAEWVGLVVRWRRSLSESFRMAVPEAAEILAMGDPRGRAEVVLNLLSCSQVTECEVASLLPIRAECLPNSSDRMSLCHLAERYNLRSLRKTVAPLIADSSSDVAVSALRALQDLGPDGCFGPLAALDIPPRSDGAIFQEWLLRIACRTTSRDEFVEALGHESPAVRARVYFYLLDGKVEDANALLAAGLEDRDESVRSSIITMIRRHRLYFMVPLISRRLGSDRSEIRRAAAAALAGIGGEAVIPQLWAMTGDPDPVVASTARFALASFVPPTGPSPCPPRCDRSIAH